MGISIKRNNLGFKCIGDEIRAKEAAIARYEQKVSGDSRMPFDKVFLLPVL